MPTMNDVVGPRQLVSLEPASQARSTFGIAQGKGTSHRFDRMNRIQVADQRLLPEAAIRTRRGFRTNQIDLMTA